MLLIMFCYFSMHNEKKKHIGRRNLLKTNRVNHHRNMRIFNNKQSDNTFESLEHKDDEEKPGHIYELFYAELIKYFLLENTPKDFNLTELELNLNIFLAADEYYAMNEDMYEVIKISSKIIKTLKLLGSTQITPIVM